MYISGHCINMIWGAIRSLGLSLTQGKNYNTIEGKDSKMVSRNDSYRLFEDLYDYLVESMSRRGVLRGCHN